MSFVPQRREWETRSPVLLTVSAILLSFQITSPLVSSVSGCDILVDDKTVMTLITDPKVKLKYQHLITNSFVEVRVYGGCILLVVNHTYSPIVCYAGVQNLSVHT